ncbi:MAG: lytic transglycosylase domain-containing protein [Pseudomonadota bacterium]
MKTTVYIILSIIILLCPCAYYLETASIETIEDIKALSSPQKIFTHPEFQPTPWKRKLDITYKIKRIKHDTEIPAIELATCIVDLADKYRLDPEMVLAVMATESMFKPDVISSTGDHGLMQINKQWWFAELKKQGIVRSPADLLRIETNIEAGCFILAKISQHKPLTAAIGDYHSTTPALAAAYTQKVLSKMGEI